MYIGTGSEEEKIFNNSRSRSQNRNQFQNGRERSQSQPRYNNGPNTRYDPNYRSRVDRFKSIGRRQESLNHDQLWTQSKNNTYLPIRCISCRCNNCYNNRKTLQEIKDLLHKKLDVKLVGQEPPPANVNLCEATAVPEEMMINYTYTDQGRQMMILDLGAPLSVAGVPWMNQYLAGFGL